MTQDYKPSPESFDPSYGYSQADLLQVGVPAEHESFRQFWETAYNKAQQIAPLPVVRDTGRTEANWRIFDINYRSTDNMSIGGWLLIPDTGKVKRGFVIGHGYGGRDEPDTHLPFKNAALLFPCCRGISRTPLPNISADPNWHVLHNIDQPDRYVHRGCVEDTWLGVSALLRLFPQVEGHLGYLGVSFGGGIGALALAWDKRVQRAHFKVPSFGNHPIRLTLPTYGSGASVTRYHNQHPEKTFKTLRLFDAAVAATHIDIPVFCACALRDPFVAPPGQFSIYNALSGTKKLQVLQAGHEDNYPGEAKDEEKLLRKLRKFFKRL